jgi:hypothetical protein
MIEWINSNKEWVFSGTGVFLLTIVAGVIKAIFFKKRNVQSERTINMNGDKSVYVERNDGEINM